MNQLEEVTAKHLGEAQRWGETIIAELQIVGTGYAKAKGQAADGELEVGLWYRFFGRWTTHYRYGRQFLFQTFVPSRALDQDGLVRYLCRAPHVGKITARKLCKLYGSDAVKTLRTEPDRCFEEAKVRGFKVEYAREAAEFLAGEARTEEATVELIGLFAGRTLPRALPKKCIKQWGNEAADKVRENPFRLLRFKGVGFLRADELYLSLGHDPESVERQGLCAWYRCAADTNGDTWLDGGTIHSELLQKIGGTRARPADAARWAIGRGLLEIHRDEVQRPWFADHARAHAEAKIAEYAAGMLHYGVPEWPEMDGVHFPPATADTRPSVTDHQAEQLLKALRGRLALFTGSPGTGKTFVAARLVAAIQERTAADNVAVVAPTGKAAVRISEALQEYGISIRATTVHSFLEVAKSDDEDESDFDFRRGPAEPVNQRFVVCDESSMLDTWLLSKLLGAMRMDGHLLLVGDVNQLPPVSHGAPLRDLIAAGVPRGELTEIRRNAGAIVETCAAIRDSSDWTLAESLDLEHGRNLMLRRLPQGQQDEVLNILERVRQGGEHDPIWDVQVVVAVNERSQLSRVELNARIQAALNVQNRPEKDAKFWKDDKVVCLKNSFFPAVEALMGDQPEEEVVVQETEDGRPELYVANGELGRVLGDEPNKVVVEFHSPRRVVLIPKGDGGTDRLDLGYAMSVHKSQGSEWPIVVVGLDDSGGARMVCDRSWLYTAISRAKRACILVGLEATAKSMCERVKIESRKTFLVERFAVAKEELKTREENREPSAAQTADQCA